MKKLLGTIAALVLLAGCGAPESPAGGGQPAAPETTSAAPEPPDEVAEEAPADSDFVATIDGSHQTKDYEGNPALVVDFTFTNNGDDAASFLIAVRAQAFQNGVELETAVIMDDDEYSADNSMKEIKPGASIEAQMAYILDDDSEVTIEVTETFSFDDAMLATTTISIE